MTTPGTLGPNGIPLAASLFQIIQASMEAEGVTVAAHVIRPVTWITT